MRPVSLAFEHFGSYRERQYIDFSVLDDFFLIYGKTGSGKTTIFDAIAFALYGEALGGRSNLERELASKFSPAGSKPWVEFEFIASDSCWKVYRSLPYKKKNRKGVESEAASEVTLWRLHDSGEIELVTDRLAEANATLLKLLKLRADEFSKIVLLPQGAFQEFLEMKTTDRVEILQKLFDVAMYDRIAEKAHQQAVELDSSLKMRREEMGRLTDELGPEPELRLEKDGAEIQKIDEDISRATKELSNLETEINRTQDQLMFWKQISDAWQAFVEIENTRPAFESRATRLAAVRNLSEIARSGQRIQDQYAEAISIVREAIESGRTLAELEGERTEIEAEEKGLPEKRKGRDELQQSIALLQRAAEEWGKRDKLERSRIDVARKLDAVEAEYARQEGEINGLKKSIGELELVIEGESAVQEALRKTLMAGESLKRMSELLEQVGKLEAEREKILRKISSTEDFLSALEDEITSAERHRDELEDQARHARAGFLAASLIDGQPCPVCGSTTHPRPVQLSSSAPDEGALRQASTEVEAKKSQRAALFQSAASDRDRAGTLASERVDLAKKLSTAWIAYTELSDTPKREPGAEKWHAALEEAGALLDAQQRMLRAEIERFAAARGSLTQRRLLLSQRERDFAATVRQKSDLEMARAEADVHLASLMKDIGYDDPNPRLSAARKQLVAAESEIERIQQRAQHWRVAFSAASSELGIHLASCAAKSETLWSNLGQFLDEAKNCDAERLIGLAEGLEGVDTAPLRTQGGSAVSEYLLLAILDELARLLSQTEHRAADAAIVSENRRSLVSLLSSRGTCEPDAIELVRRVIDSVWPQVRLREEEEAIGRFRESWTKSRAAYGAFEGRALSMGAKPCGWESPAITQHVLVQGSYDARSRDQTPPSHGMSPDQREAAASLREHNSRNPQPLIFDFEAEARTLSDARATLESCILGMEASIGALRDQRAALSAGIERTRTLVARRQELSREYDAGADEFGKRDMLDRLLSGSLNLQRKMPFKNYVLGQQFKEIAARASERLYRMSSGRYIVEADILSGGGNKKIGLELSVFDAWNGGSRPVGTLSGGEKFMLSISLALGLADSIQERAGANRIESLFIDEGFGSLDEESLSLAVSVLDELRGDKKIAIISHVEELYNRIPSRIVVKKGVGGSRLEFERG